MMRYQEALSRCLEAIAEGRDLESVIAGLPARHRDALRQDAALRDALRRHAAAVPPPSQAAEVNALSRLNAELNSARAARQASASRGSFFGVPRFALAGLLLAALLLGASFILGPNRDGNGTVEAAEFEGVVVANDDGSLTVQTLDTLEEVMVPLSAQVMDENGTVLTLASLEVGEVVIVHGLRPPGGPVQAQDVRRLVNGLPGWCDENAERCRQIAQNLREAQERCRRDPEACRLLHDRLTDVLTRVTDVADLEELKQRCREAGGEGCFDIASFCREHPDACMRDFPPPTGIDRLEDARERLQQLEELCADRDTSACRHIAQLCAEHPVLCSDTPAQPPRAPLTDAPATVPAPAETPPAREPSARPAPTATPSSDQQPTTRSITEDTRATDTEPAGPTSEEAPPDDSTATGDRGDR